MMIKFIVSKAQSLSIVVTGHIEASPNFLTPASQMVKAAWKAIVVKFQFIH